MYIFLRADKPCNMSHGSCRILESVDKPGEIFTVKGKQSLENPLLLVEQRRTVVYISKPEFVKKDPMESTTLAFQFLKA